MNLMLRLLLTGLLCSAAWPLQAAEAPPAAARKIDFNREIRPILSETCFTCHGPDEKARKAELRLDQKAEAFRDRRGSAAVIPGKPEQSELFLRITSTDEVEQMPPADSGKKKLTSAQIETLRLWIAQGAEWKEHWAYQPPAEPRVPESPEPSFIRNPIDQFVLRTLEQKGLKHAAEADRVTLLRRLSFDVVGLPPTPKEVAEFVNDTSPDAYEKVVDRLLASPRFGERMAMMWLDFVRYADTNGIHGDNHQDVDLFRDYVIRAFNDNMPFDRFTIEQLAGDLLPEVTTQTKIASGYNRLLMTTAEGGAQAKEYMAKYAADRVRNVSSVWLGSTMGCCECHDHKYDPFLTRDFYRMEAFFADVQEKAVGLQDPTAEPTPEQEQELAQLQERATPFRKTMETNTPDLEAAQRVWEEQTLGELASTPRGWQVVKPTKLESSGKQTLTIQDDSSVLASGENPDNDTYTVTLSTDRPQVTGLRLETLMHPSLANGSLSRANGNFVVTDVSVEVIAAPEATPVPVKLIAALADFEQAGHPVGTAIDNKPDTGWAVEGHVKKADHKAVFVFEKPVAAGPSVTFVLRLKHESPYPKHNIGRFRVAVTSEEKPTLSDFALPETLVAALQAKAEKRTAEQQMLLAKHYRGIAPALAEVRGQLATLDQKIDALKKSFRKTLVTVSMAPRMIRVLPRGNWLDDSGEEVKPGVPSFLATLKTEGERANRLDLARWIVSSDNPLTARVFVNRLWKIAFGQGLVKTLEDFGSQGTPPTHPELLDWLALDFANHGWDVKRSFRQILLSGAYRQASNASDDLKQVDPYNQWLARQGRFRLDAEMVRDNALSISGLLVEKLYGPSAKPYQPAGYWSHLNFPVREYQADTGENLYRRGVYTYWCRTYLHPSLAAFDAPSREECTIERARSNTPLQALVLLNDPSYVEAARIFAERIVREGGADVTSRIDYAFQTALSRAARPQELAVLRPLYEKHLTQYQTDEKARQALLAVGARPAAKDLNPAEVAAWTTIARVLLNLHETITRS